MRVLKCDEWNEVVICDIYRGLHLNNIFAVLKNFDAMLIKMKFNLLTYVYFYPTC